MTDGRGKATDVPGSGKATGSVEEQQDLDGKHPPTLALLGKILTWIQEAMGSPPCRASGRASQRLSLLPPGDLAAWLNLLLAGASFRPRDGIRAHP